MLVNRLYGAGAGALEEHDVRADELRRHTESRTEPLERGDREEADMRLVVFVMPPGKGLAVGHHLGHDRQDATGTYAPPHRGEGLVRAAKVFDHLGGGDEIVGPAEGRLVGREEGVVECHCIADLGEHHREGGPGPGSEVESRRAGGYARGDRVGRAREEATVARVVRRVLVELVDRALFGG